MSISRRGFLAMPLFLAACNFDQRAFEISGPTMGTYYKVSAVGVPGHIDEHTLKSAIEKSLAHVNRQLSNWDPASEISRFNANQTTTDVTVSPILAEVMQAAEEVNQLSAGRFDTTIAPVIELWGFGTGKTATKTPSKADIQRAVSNSGHRNNLKISENHLKKQKPQTEVFLAAIGKGFGADMIGRALKGVGVNNYMIEIGGDIYASGHNPNGLPWQIGVETPQSSNRGVMDVVGISNLGMASSGDYRNYFEADGVRYSHVIDPTNGEPIKHRTASATVLAESGMLADAWATALLTLGREKGLEIANANDVAVMFIDRSGSGNDLKFEVTKNARFTALQA